MRYPISKPNAFSVASTTSAVPGGPMIGSGAGSGANVVTHRVMITSPRSAMWSLCRWVSSSAVKLLAPTPIAAVRCCTPRPQSTRKVCPPARTSVDGPARRGSGIGLPVPSRVTSIMGPGIPVGRQRCGAIRGRRTPRSDLHVAGRTPPRPPSRDARLLRVERHRQRTEILFHAGGATGPGDRRGGDAESVRAVPQPGQGDLRRGRAPGLRRRDRPGCRRCRTWLPA